MELYSPDISSVVNAGKDILADSLMIQMMCQ